ncbi:uncharacterized protein PGTG_09483 [Puccinia graminis f. sp. tritici CRL 75-36-700-3]|uniref:Uncharacterized protein n=1 Tax=Puccinia graminis f. sp. tritici (strain CRL 75-36-700-3 / race SCCL) TaxID=418459 RepID=E3KHJ5_PUCGT|nr:uncharacterized protein PGTG_09483 [Puccinia graminis f. sp. tritici CRL 75-36-700-3]EFP83770.2 hypothetical protein PGTG_09483 [Puccinia graminis f. sp. tritici CRL 75-36-700-3]
MMVPVATLTRSRSYRFYIAAWCFILALISCRMFDLNQLPEEDLDEAFPGVAAEISRGKRKEHPVQLPSLSPPTSRVCRSDDQGGPSNSGSITARLRAEHEVDIGHSGVQEPTTAVDSVNIGSGISQSIAGSHPNQAGQSSSGGGSKSMDHPDNDFSDSDQLPGLPVVEKKHWDELDFPHLITRGAIVEELLNKFGKSFQSKVTSEDCRSRHWGLVDPHPTLSSARIDVAVRDRYKLAKVLQHDFSYTQTGPRLYMLYKFLAVSLYKLHGEFLTQINIPVLHHRNLQEKLFEWLEKEIFTPKDSHPVLGIAPGPDLTWESGGPDLQKYGAIQEELIRYFSDERSDPNISTSVILEQYRAKHAKKYLALRQLSGSFPEDPNRPSIKPNFPEILEYLSNMAENLEINLISHNDRHSKTAREHSALVSPYVLMFEKTFRAAEIDKGDLRSYYPTLPISMCFHDHVPGPKPLRMIDPNGKIYDVQTLRPKLRRMLKAVDILHIKAMSKLKRKLSAQCIKKRRQSASKFLIDSLTRPKGSLPLIGRAQSPEGIAPWFSKSYGKPIYFGEVQLKMLKYFSEELEKEDLIHIPAFLLLSWHCANPKYQLKSS